MYKRMTLNNGVINDYALKSSIFFNDYVLLITGSYTYFIRTEIKPSSISAFLVVISEIFSRNTKVWPKNSPPCVQWWTSIEVEDYGSKQSFAGLENNTPVRAILTRIENGHDD